MNKITIFDLNQGLTENGRTFGYVGIENRGGYFFTWLPTLAETLASIEPGEPSMYHNPLH